MAAVITRDIDAFVNRDWDAVRRAKDEYWAERIARLGSDEAFRIADELRRQALLQHPAWPDAEERRADFAAHVRLARTLRLAASTCRS